MLLVGFYLLELPDEAMAHSAARFAIEPLSGSALDKGSGMKNDVDRMRIKVENFNLLVIIIRAAVIVFET